MRKSKIKLTVKKTFDACKSACARKIRFRAAESYAGMSERRILKITNNNFKYRQFNAKFTNKAIPRPIRVKRVMEQLQLDLVDMRSQAVEYNGKSYRYILSLMDIFSRFHWLVPLKRNFASNVAFYLNRIFMEHRPPDKLQTDNGGEFKKDVIKVNKYNLDITLIFGKCGLCVIFFKELFSQNFFHLTPHRRFNDLQVLKRKNFPYFYNLLQMLL